ncbi:MAG: aspartate aminotransferase family protein [Candidatus Dormibacteraeota bacterium]|nr:aspartate aminotransferase family protein [Candidatus Dormibacteraeota bacterium]
MSTVFRRSPGGPVTSIARGEGVWLWDTQGRRYLDGCSGAVVVNVGHGRTEVVEAMARQGRQVAYVHNGEFTSEAAEDFTARLAALAPRGLDRVYPVSGGSEATESALKLARAYHRLRGNPAKWRVIARRVSYHGNTVGALSMSGHAVRRAPYAPLLLDFPHIEGPDLYRDPDPASPASTGAALEEAILAAGPETVAAFIAEPVVGAAGGALTAPPGHFERIREICDRHDVLFIADEVMTGVGRTGRMWGIQHSDAAPDLLVAGKGLASGYAPLAAVLVSARIHDLFTELDQPFVHGFTYAGHPISCAAGCAVLDIVVREGLVERAAERGERLEALLREVAARHPMVGDVRGRGLMRGIELVADPESKAPFPAGMGVAGRLGDAALRRGLCVYPGGGHLPGPAGDQALIAPPLVVDDAELGELASRLDESLGELERELTAEASMAGR